MNKIILSALIFLCVNNLYNQEHSKKQVTPSSIKSLVHKINQTNNTSKTNTQTYALDSILEWRYNETLSDWEYDYKYIYSYNSNDQVTAEVEYWWNDSTNSWETLYKMELVYNNDGHLSKIYNYDFENESFVLYSKAELILNSNNDFSSYIYSDFENNIWITTAAEEWEYNINNQLISETYYDVINGNNINTSRWIYSYSGDKLNSTLLENWNEDLTEWQSSRKNEYSYNSNNLLTSDIEYYWENNSWVNSYKENFTYDGFNNTITSKSYYWDETDNSWKNSFDYSHNYNTLILKGNVLSIEDVFGEYNISVSYENMYLGYTNYNYDYFTGQAKPWSKASYYYSEYTLYTNNLSPLNSMNIFPNPAREFIQVTGNKANNITLKISSIEGKNMQISKINNPQEKITISKLPSGIYFYTLIDENLNIFNGSLIKQ